MSTWIEYLAAVVIAAFIAVTLFTVQLRSQEVTIDSAQYRAAKTTAVSVIQMIESDVKNLGSQHPASEYAAPYTLPGGAAFPILDAPDTTSTPRTFQFYAQPRRGQPTSLIRYEWEPAGSVTLSDGTTREVVNFRRLVNGTVDGRSTGVITMLSFNLLEADGTTITNVNETRQLFVELRAVSPLGAGRTIEETRWKSVFQPLGLTITH